MKSKIKALFNSKWIDAIRQLLLVGFNPIWYLQLLIPRNKDLWVFGAWMGNKYSDNAKVFYEFVKKKDPDIRAVWLTRNKDIKNQLEVDGHEVYMINSSKGIFISLKCSIVIISSGKPDVNSFFINGAKIVQLWHGGQLKKIGLDDKLVHNKVVDKFKSVLLPFIFDYNLDYVVSTSKIFNSKLASAFNINHDRILETGYPRNDIFFEYDYVHPIISRIVSEFNEPNLILYLPTFRSTDYTIDLFYGFDFDEIRFNNFLEETNSIFITKGHYIDDGFKFDKEIKRIINLTDTEVPEINPVMKNVDILLTDYSSAYFDFLLTEKPLVFTAFDLSEYVTNSRELYFNYPELVSGPITSNWIETENELRKILLKDEYREIRAEKNKLYNQYNNGQSSMTLLRAIKSSLNGINDNQI